MLRARTTPPTVLHQQRILEALRRGGPPPLQQAVQADAERVADAIRSKLRDFRSGLQGIENGLQFGTMLLQASVDGNRRAPPVSQAESSLMAVLGLIVSAIIAVGVLSSNASTLSTQTSHSVVTTQAPANLEQEVATVAQAIAVAEGFYASGKHDGHSLPHMLNNPGSLKKPAFAANALPTWEDSGLVMFPSEQRGWDALKHQVRLMLTGHSSVYRLNDTIAGVASKYADGDANWGLNVARTLHVSPGMTLGEIAANANEHSSLFESLRTWAFLDGSASTLGN